MDSDGCRRLAIAVLARAFRDAAGKNVTFSRDALEWLRSSDAKNLADLCGLELNQSRTALQIAIRKTEQLTDKVTFVT